MMLHDPVHDAALWQFEVTRPHATGIPIRPVS